jgi:nitrogen regulatory protein PII
MKLITAVIKPFKLDDVKIALKPSRQARRPIVTVHCSAGAARRDLLGSGEPVTGSLESMTWR